MLYLHSTLFKLLPDTLYPGSDIFPNLHSTLFKLLRTDYLIAVLKSSVFTFYFI